MPEPSVRKEAVKALLKLGPTGSKHVVALLVDRSAGVQAEAVRALAGMGPVGAPYAAEIAAIAIDPTQAEAVRHAAVECLGVFGESSGEQGAAAAAALLKYPTSKIRCSAAEALGKMGQ